MGLGLIFITERTVVFLKPPMTVTSWPGAECGVGQERWKIPLERSFVLRVGDQTRGLFMFKYYYWPSRLSIPSPASFVAQASLSILNP